MSPGGTPLTTLQAARVLGVAPDADPQTVRAAFRAQVKRHHPDRPGGDAERLRAVIAAYEALKDAPPPPPRERPAPSPILEISPAEAFCGGRHLTQASDGRAIYVTLPPGLRAGDLVRVAGQVRAVTIATRDGMAVIGDHLCLTVRADPAVLRKGGSLTIDTLIGTRTVRVTRQDGMRGLVRIVGKGLPPRAGRPRGDLLLRLSPAASAEAPASATAGKRNRFSADWAA